MASRGHQPNWGNTHTQGMKHSHGVGGAGLKSYIRCGRRKNTWISWPSSRHHWSIRLKHKTYILMGKKKLLVIGDTQGTKEIISTYKFLHREISKGTMTHFSSRLQMPGEWGGARNCRHSQWNSCTWSYIETHSSRTHASTSRTHFDKRENNSFFLIF